MENYFTRLTLMIIIAALIACSSDLGEKSPERTQWDESKLNNYSYTLVLGCWDCDERKRFRVKHQTDETTYTQLPIRNYQESASYDFKAEPRDITELFDVIDGIADPTYFIRRVIHDEQYGFPSYIFYEDELGQTTFYEVTEFETEDYGLNAIYEHLALWNSRKLSDYTYTQNIECVCDINGTIDITVRKDNVAEAFSSASGQNLPPSEINQLYLTVDELYSLLYSAYRGKYLISATYNSESGVPETIVVEGQPFGTSGDIKIGISTLTELAQTQG